MDSSYWDNIATSYERFHNLHSTYGEIKLRRKAKLLIDLAHITTKSDVLEIGCGTGAFTKYLMETGANIIALDSSENMLRKASKAAWGGNVVFSWGDVHKPLLPPSSFDAIAGGYILMYLDLAVALPNIKRLLKPGGRVVFLEPNALNPVAYALTRIKLVKKLARRPDNTHSFTPSELRNAFEYFNFRDVSIQPIEFYPGNVPRKLVPLAECTNALLEMMPGVMWLGGTLVVSGSA